MPGTIQQFELSDKILKAALFNIYKTVLLNFYTSQDFRARLKNIEIITRRIGKTSEVGREKLPNSELLGLDVEEA